MKIVPNSKSTIITFIVLAFTLHFSFILAQGNKALAPYFLFSSPDSISVLKNDLTIPKRKINFNYFRRHISPMISYKFGGDLLHNGDTSFVHSVEIGTAFIRGNVNDWSSWGPIPMGFDWGYYTLPFISLEYRWQQRVYKNTTPIPEDWKFKSLLLNIGVSGGTGLLITFLPVPISINGMAGLSTDFNQLYFRGRMGWDLLGFSLGVGFYASLTKKTTPYNSSHYSFVEVSYVLIR